MSIEINELPPPPSIPTASVTVVPTCVSQLGTIVVSNPTAGHTYSFDDGISFQTSRTKSNLSPNLYLVRVKANNTGCISPAVIISLDSAICAPLASIKPGTLEPKKNTLTQSPVINKSIPYGSLSIYPNPASSFFSIDLEETNTTEEVTIRMSDQFGRVVKQLKRNTAQLRQESFNTYEFHSGQYFIEVISQERRYPVKRLVILK